MPKAVMRILAELCRIELRQSVRHGAVRLNQESIWGSLDLQIFENLFWVLHNY